MKVWGFKLSREREREGVADTNLDQMCVRCARCRERERERESEREREGREKERRG